MRLQESLGVKSQWKWEKEQSSISQGPTRPKGNAEKDGAYEEVMNKFGVRLEDDEEGQYDSSQDSNNFKDIA